MQTRTTGNGYLFKRGKHGETLRDSDEGIYYLQYEVNRHRKLISMKTDNKAIAEKKRKELLLPALMLDSKEKVILHIAQARKILNNVKFPLDTVWSKYENSAKRPQSSPGTLKNYKRMWMGFKGWLNTEYPQISIVSQITDKEAEEYSNFLWSMNIAENTYNYHIQALTLVLRIITGEAKTVFSDIKRKKGISISRLDFSPEQVNKIFSVLNDKKFKIMHKDEMRFLCYIGNFTGLRLHDAVMLKTESVDLKKNLISLTPAKTRNIQRQVHIPIHSELRKQFDNVNMKLNYVLPSISERYLRNPTGVKLDFMSILDEAGLTDFRTPAKGRRRRLYGFHSFRHSFASFAANSGVPITTLAALLGDNAGTLEKYYVKVSDKSKLAAIDSLPSIASLNDSPSVVDKEAMSIRVACAILLIQELKIGKKAKQQLLTILQT